MPANEGSPWIIETDEDTFEQDVFQRSHQIPVVVDFWAAWCQPCRMLGPVLEQLAQQYEGRFVLVKADTDRVPRAAAEFNVQGIPAVFGLCGGEVVDFFNGALPPEQVRQWIDRLLVSAESLQARQLEATDPAAAQRRYRDLLEQQPENAAAAIGLARVLVAQQQLDEARQLIEQVELTQGFLDDEGERVKAALDLEELSDVDCAQARAALQADPENAELKVQLAQALASQRQFKEALETCLDVVQHNQSDARDEARAIMLDIFRVLPDESLVHEFQRKLSTALY